LHHDNLFTHDVLLSGSFWPKNWYWNQTIRHIHHLFPCVTFVYSQTENYFEGPQIFRHCRYLGKRDDHSEENFRRLIPALFWRVRTLPVSVLLCREMALKVIGGVSVYSSEIQLLQGFCKNFVTPCVFAVCGPSV
jgi:hypothetical protein